jgi:hypothetical protein
MGGYALDGNTQMQCPHGGTVTVQPKEQRVMVRDSPVFVMKDFSPPAPAISGCSFNISGTPSPCMQVKWLLPAQKVEIDGSPVLTSLSVGLCVTAAQVPQGKAIVTGFQTEVQVT